MVALFLFVVCCRFSDSLFLSQSRKPVSLLVTTPQAIALSDVRKEAAFCRKLDLPIVGIVENMSGYVCEKCAECTNIFSSDGGRLLAEELGVPFAGRVPIDPRVSACEDAGRDFFATHPDATSLQCIVDVAQQLADSAKKDQQQ